MGPLFSRRPKRPESQPLGEGVVSRLLTDDEQKELLDAEGRLAERDALALLAAANRTVAFEVRGLRFPLTKFRWPRTHFVRTTFVDSDLGSPRVAYRPFSKRIFEGCRFSNVKMDGLSIDDCLFRSCLFERAVFGQNLYGLLARSRFEDCTFVDCALSQVELRECLLVRCRFDLARGDCFVLRGCRVTDSSIAGSFGVVHFLSSVFENVGLEGSVFEDASLIGNTYTRVRFPEAEANHVVTPETLKAFRAEAEGHFSEAGLAWLESFVGADLEPITDSCVEELTATEARLLRRFAFPSRVRGEYSSGRR